MEKRITYNGKLMLVEDLVLPEDIKEKLYHGFYYSTNLKQLGKDLGLSERAVTVLFEYYLEKLQETKAPYITDSLPVKTILGKKEEPYFKDEDEILKDLNHNYSWEDLSLHEKQFYLNYNGNKKRCFVRKRDEASDSESHGIQ